MTDNDTGTEPFIGEVRMFAGNSEPAGWAFCDGRLLSTNAYAALYGIIGTTYGGDGIINFALPDLRGRVVVGNGAAPRLSNRILGQQTGAESVTLSVANLPCHSHAVQGTNASGNSSSPGGNLIAGSSVNAFAPAGSALVRMGATTGPSGSGAPVSTFQPSLVLNFIIALRGRDPRPGAGIILPLSPPASA